MLSDLRDTWLEQVTLFIASSSYLDERPNLGLLIDSMDAVQERLRREQEAVQEAP